MMRFGKVVQGVSLGLLGLILHAASPGDVQGQVRVGVQGMYTSGSAATVDSSFGIGGRLILEVPRYPFEVHGVFDYHFPDCPSSASNCTSWTGVGNVYYRGGGGPYFIGGGITRHRRDFDLVDSPELAVVEEWGYNLALGLILPVLPVLDPLIEFRYEFYDEVQDQFVISLGLVL